MGIICGLGKQKIATRVTIVGQYILGIPFAFTYVLYYNGGFAGLWYGQSLAFFFNLIFYFVIITITDWNKAVMEATERMSKATSALTPRTK